MPISFQNWLWCFARPHVIMKANRLASSVCPQSFDLAPKPFSDLVLGSVNACRLTMRAADKWESARFQAVCVASSFFRFRALLPLRPLAANAGRWAAAEMDLLNEKQKVVYSIDSVEYVKGFNYCFL